MAPGAGGNEMVSLPSELCARVVSLGGGMGALSAGDLGRCAVACGALRAAAADGARARLEEAGEGGGGARLLDGETWVQALRVEEARWGAGADSHHVEEVEAEGREALRMMIPQDQGAADWEPLEEWLKGMEAQWGRAGAVRWLSGLDTDLDATTSVIDGSTALCFAAEQGRQALVRALAAAGADINAAKQDRATPTFMAAAKGHEAVVRALIGAGADV